MKPVGMMLVALVSVGAGGRAGELTSQRGWTWHPSLQVFGSIDEIGEGAPAVVRSLADVSPALGVAAASEVAWEGRRGRLQATGFGLLGSPFANRQRTYFLAGRVHAVRSLDNGWRLSFDDSARWQRREALTLTDFQRNEAIAGVEWRSAHAGTWGLRLSDRRRALPCVRELGFSRQGASLASRFGLGARVSLEAAATWQHYSALTAKGERYLLSAEVARFDRRGVASARVSWFWPQRAVALSATGPWLTGDTAATPLDPSEAGIGTRNNLVENLTLPSSPLPETLDATGGMDADLAGDPLLFDPLESDSDEWDFGRHKQVLVGFLSRRLGRDWLVSAAARYQHRHGPNLLVPREPARSDYDDKQLALRVSVRRRLGTRLSLLVQGCHLQGWADRSSLRFSRTLVAVGLQYRH